MKLSREWLAEFTDINATDKEYNDAMTASGSKVETTECLGTDIENVVAGRVLEIVRHENSDHMFVCQVDVGFGTPVQIVTGAQNVRQGDWVPAALDGAKLPGGKEIHTGELRGVVSAGMLCSLGELGLDTHDYPYCIEDGIFILSDDPELKYTAGQDIREVLGLNDSVVEFEITSNRVDCYSVIGLARETAATFDTSLKLHDPVVEGSGGDISELLDVDIMDAVKCPRYTARMVKNIKVAPSPLWLRRRLRACGVRPINNIVDITNYVMLEYGQPMHAFDYRMVKGGHIIVRTAENGEELTTLDGQPHILDENMLVISDDDRAVALAGVMGGLNSEIVDDTEMIVFESANFFGANVRQTAVRLGMRTDASGLYEKGLDPLNTLPAVQRACELVELLGAGEVIDGIIDVIASDKAPVRVKLDMERINGLIGVEFTEEFARTVLAKIGFEFDGDMVIVPHWRSDVEHYSDLAEEVARFYGFENIPVTQLRGETLQGRYSDVQNLEIKLGQTCRGLGFTEILTYSFTSPSIYDRLRLPQESPLRDTINIINPLGEDTSVMRTVSLASMLEILARNYNFRNKSVKLYELAKTYKKQTDSRMAEERKVLTLGAYGDGMSFYEFKGYVEAILRTMNVTETVSFTAEKENPSYHPGRCAAVTSAGRVLGVFGQVHPKITADYDIGEEVYVCELDMDTLFAARAAENTYHPLPRFPAMHRDLAVVCDKSVPVAVLEDCISRSGGETVEAVEFFDVYTGAQVSLGKKSVAFSITLRSRDQSLTDEHADEVMSGILAALKSELNAVIR